MFITIPDIFETIPMGQVCMIILSVALFFAAITSPISLIEAIVEFIESKFKISRLTAVWISILLSAVFSILTDGHIDGLMDILQIHLVPFLRSYNRQFFRVCYQKRVIKEIQSGRSAVVGKLIIPMGRYVFCELVLSIYLCNLLHLG